MMYTRRQRFWLSALTVLGVVALMVMIGHVAAGHHGGNERHECPLCLMAFSVVVVVAVGGPSVFLVFLGFVHCRAKSSHAHVLTSTSTRSPPPSNLLHF